MICSNATTTRARGRDADRKKPEENFRHGTATEPIKEKENYSGAEAGSCRKFATREYGFCRRWEPPRDTMLTEHAVAERARKLRSNYNIHAQSLRTRIEIRVNRIPMSLRRMKMEDLLQRYSSDTQSSTSSANTTAKPQQRGPPVPEKDRSPERPVTSRPVYQIAPPPAARPKRRRYVPHPL